MRLIKRKAVHGGPPTEAGQLVRRISDAESLRTFLCTDLGLSCYYPLGEVFTVGVLTLRSAYGDVIQKVGGGYMACALDFEVVG